MPLADIDDAAVRSAIEEFQELGRDRFLERYGFGRSREYYLSFQGRLYDSKATLGVAYKYARPDLGPLTADQFSGGNLTVRKRLDGLGFHVVPADEVARTSAHLDEGRMYTRDDLREAFGIVDATLHTGVFRPKGTRSVWLFVTEEKTSDRTQYRDHVDGDVLYWQGQMAMRKIAISRCYGVPMSLGSRMSIYETP